MSFEQVLMEEKDRNKCCFWFDGQLYRWRVMPFGALNAPFVMQRVVDQALVPVRDVARALIDDIILTTKGGVDPYCEALGRVLDALIAFNLRGALHKVKLGYLTLESLGHVVSGLGVGIPSNRIRAIRDMHPPQNAKAAISCLAAFGYWRRFVPGFADVVRPIHEVSIAPEWKWGPEQDAAWAAIKTKLVEAPILRHPVVGKSYFVRTDASGYAIAAVYLQSFEDEEGRPHLHPNAYYSRKLSRLERGRGATDTELLAVDDALQEGRLLLHGAEFTLETDHMALESVIRSENFANPRIARAVMRVQEFFPFKVVHRKGKSPQMALPDVMSRDAQYLLEEPAHTYDQVVALVAGEADVVVPTLAEAQRADPVTAALIEAVTKNRPAVLPEAQTLRLQFKGELHVRNGVLLHVANRRGRYTARRYVPPQLRTYVATECHKEAHLRGEPFYARVLNVYFWPDALKDLDRVADNCRVCAEVNAPHERLTGVMRAKEGWLPW